MTTLSIFHQNQPEQAQTVVTDPDTIRNKLSAHGVHFDRWATRDLPADATQEEILEAYADEVARLNRWVPVMLRALPWSKPRIAPG